MRSNKGIILGAALALLVIGCDSGTSKPAAPSAQPSASLSASPGAPASVAAPIKDQIPGRHGGLKDRIPRPQSPDYYGGQLKDTMPFFYGRVEAGRVTKTTDAKGNALPAGQAVPGDAAGRYTVTFTTPASDNKDPCLRAPADFPLYTLSEPALGDLCDDWYEATKEERASCPSTDGIQGRAMALPGRWDDEGKYDPNAKVGNVEVFTFACMTGSAAKCAHWGYVPWLYYDKGSKTYSATPSASATSLNPYYVACVHAARADYEANGKFMTCNATVVDVFDNLGINACERNWAPDAGAPSLESTWRGDNGKPQCVLRTRYSGCSSAGTNPSCDTGLTACPEPGASWPSGVILGVRSPVYPPPKGSCPTSDDLCDEKH